MKWIPDYDCYMNDEELLQLANDCNHFDRDTISFKQEDMWVMPYRNDLKPRLAQFSIRTLHYIAGIPDKPEFRDIKWQLSKSATSIAANYIESQSSTYKEFIQKVRTALREANETQYWIYLLHDNNAGNVEHSKWLIDEIDQICRILGSITSKAHRKLRKEKKGRTH